MSVSQPAPDAAVRSPSRNTDSGVRSIHLAASEAVVADVSGSALSVDYPASRPDRAIESSANTMNSSAPSAVVTGSDTRPFPSAGLNPGSG